MRMIVCLLAFICLGIQGEGRIAPATSIAREWNEEILAAIRIDLPNPPVHARNLFHLSSVMYDAWAAYETNAAGYLYHQKHSADDLEAARRETISYAAYRLLTNRYTLSAGKTNTLPRLEAKLISLGYNPEVQTLDGESPAAIGNRIAALISEFSIEDGSFQSRGYRDLPFNEGGYLSVNPPLVTGASDTFIANINRWQPLIITNAVSQNDIPVDQVQKFVGSQWKGARPFALQRDYPDDLWSDPGPPPQLGGAGDAEFRAQVVEVIRLSSQLDPSSDEIINISPGAIGNNTLGTNDGSGHPVNPVTGQPYLPQMVKRADFGRVLAEYWADGPKSETPPGHWNLIANQVSDSPGFQKRIGGAGPLVDALEWDVKVYFAINGAMHDAACAAWSLKRQYDGWRPISAIRGMGQLGQSTDRRGLSFHPMGLPLVTNLIEVVTTETSQTGGRHAGFTAGSIVVKSWLGEPADPKNQTGGVGWILATRWTPYQKNTFVTPAFPGYVSGHSAFSRAGAEVMAAVTGSAFMPGGLGVFEARENGYLTFEKGPSSQVQVQWATYFDAADLAGMSRLWGGIHVSADDVGGRKIGAQCGQEAWALAQRYFDGSIVDALEPLELRIDSGFVELKMKTDRGFLYRLQTSPKVEGPYSDLSNEFERATNSTSFWYGEAAPGNGFYRLLKKP
ncbi:MAG: vanadium-dependent haloperoxidase [Verrucomicrobiales bacterium]